MFHKKRKSKKKEGTNGTIHAPFTSPTTLFTHLKIILLQYFQFSVSAKISCIRLDKTYFAETKNKKHCSKIIFKCVNSVVGPIFNEKVAEK